MNYTIFIRNKVWLVILCVLLVAFGYSCKKEIYDQVSSDKSFIADVKSQFYAGHYESKLQEAFNDTAHLQLNADWNNVYINEENDLRYAYVKLSPSIVSKHNTRVTQTVRYAGVEKFIIGKKEGETLELYLGTYISDNQERTNTDPSYFSNFSGMLLLEKLDSKKIFKFIYKDGKRVNAAKNATPLSKSSASVSYYDVRCTTNFTCRWSGVCGSEVYITVTSGSTCFMPSSSPGNCMTSYWSLAESIMQESCEVVEYPDPPFPGAPQPDPVAITLASITKPGVTLKDATKNLLNQVLKDCLGRVLIGKLGSNNKKLNFVEDPSATSSGIYDPRTETVTIDPSGARIGSMLEELLHAYQDVKEGGTTKYLQGTPGGLNMEFEAKLIRDIRQTIVPRDPEQYATFGHYALGQDVEYLDWLDAITENGKAVPTDFSLIRTKYFEYLNRFGPANPIYAAKFAADPNLEPKILIDIVKDSKCL